MLEEGFVWSKVTGLLDVISLLNSYLRVWWHCSILLVTRWKLLWESTTPRESEIWGFLSPTLGNTCHTYTEGPYCDCHHNAVNGTAVAAVLIDQLRSFMNLQMYVHWIAARLPNCEIWGSCRQHLATLATRTIRSIKCKQSPVYRVFWPLLPHPSTDRNETRTWSSLSP